MSPDHRRPAPSLPDTPRRTRSQSFAKQSMYRITLESQTVARRPVEAAGVLPTSQQTFLPSTHDADVGTHAHIQTARWTAANMR